MISKEVIEERKQTLVNDIDKLEKTIAEVGKQQEQLQANMFCTTWCSPTMRSVFRSL